MAYQNTPLMNCHPIMIFLDNFALATTWVAFSSLYALWCASWLAGVFEQRRPYIQVADLPEGSKEPPKGVKAKAPMKKSYIQPIINRFKDSEDMLSDLVHMLFPALTINTFAGGSETAAMAVSMLFMVLGFGTLLANDPYGREPYGKWSLQKIAKVACPVSSVVIVLVALYQRYI